MPQTTLFLDPTIALAAGLYYTLFPVEPTPSTSADWLKVQGHANRPRTQHLTEWLSLIAKSASAGQNILLVSHGNTAGLKLYIGDEKHDVHLEVPALEAIRRNREGKDGYSDEETAKILKLQAHEYRALKQLVDKVQALKLDRVDARACNTGDNKFALSELQQFFNCNTFCAPKMFDLFGEMRVGKFATDPATFDAWVKAHSGAQVIGAPKNRFAWRFQTLTTPEAIAESADAVVAWAKAKLPTGGTFNGKTVLYYHALTGGSSVVFAGETAFSAQLAEARRGQVPSRRIDLNALPDL